MPGHSSAASCAQMAASCTQPALRSDTTVPHQLAGSQHSPRPMRGSTAHCFGSNSLVRAHASAWCVDTPCPPLYRSPCLRFVDRPHSCPLDTGSIPLAPPPPPTNSGNHIPFAAAGLHPLVCFWRRRAAPSQHDCGHASARLMAAAPGAPCSAPTLRDVCSPSSFMAQTAFDYHV